MAAPLSVQQKVVRIALLLVRAIGFLGGSLQLVLGQPDTGPRLDNVHRFMAGIYLGSAIIALWAAATVRRHDTLIDLIALAVFPGGCGHLASMAVVGTRDPTALWLAYLVPELLLPLVILAARRMGGHAPPRPPGS
jgi:peptidoglycan/LPS O-acetylase OafA/YrhL